jgi:DNA-binding LacI/PurR family transcriptional regulator
MRVTRDDVAKKAGVSTATVSYVINNKDNISEKTRKKVLDAVQELNYKPDMIARSMVTKETKQLSIILNDIANPFYSEMVLGFENIAMEKGYFVNVCTGYKNLTKYLDSFIERRIDGVFMAAIPYKFDVNKMYELTKVGIKVVMFGDSKADIKRISSIENDHIQGMDMAIKHLKNLGHKRIAYVSGFGLEHGFDKRLEGYLKAREKYNLCQESGLIVTNTKEPYDTTIDTGVRLTRKLMNSGQKFTAIVCTNDLMAFGAIHALEQDNLRVPEDVSVVGIDDISMAKIWNPSLTTLQVPKIDTGRKAFEFLYSNIKTGDTGYHVNDLELIVRNSTGPVVKE